MEIKASVIRSVLIGRCRFVILKSISDPLSKEKKILFLSLALSLSLFLHPEFPGFFSLPAFLCASHFSLLFFSPHSLTGIQENKNFLPLTMTEEYDYESLGQNSSMAQNAMAGALAGIAEHCTMYPVDSIKVHIHDINHAACLWID